MSMIQASRQVLSEDEDLRCHLRERAQVPSGQDPWLPRQVSAQQPVHALGSFQSFGMLEGEEDLLYDTSPDL